MYLCPIWRSPAFLTILGNRDSLFIKTRSVNKENATESLSYILGYYYWARNVDS